MAAATKLLMMVVVVAAAAAATTKNGVEGLKLCNMSEDDLMLCKPAVSKPSPDPPTAECCKALSGADLTCLCGYKNSQTLPLLGIDPDLAMALPSKCSLTPPPEC